MKNVSSVLNAPQPHWVGDGFPVRSLFSYHDDATQHSPFLLLDYAGPAQFPANSPRRGVGQHPHRGFETVTIVYDGEVSHRDSTGQGGTIAKGDVQWMTAGAGILHEEYHSEAFARDGGTLHMVQLWVNLPASAKMTPPRYQAILDAQIPVVPLDGQAGQVRVIAGDYQGHTGPASTHTPMQVWDVKLTAGRDVTFTVPEGWNTGLVVLGGTVQINDQTIAREGQMVLLEQQGTQVRLEANGDVQLLLLSGEPIDEPVVGYGPFVMNSQQEIVQAINDFNAGRFGQMS
ncbi:pirin family protein [Alcaligenes sp. SDU_A2]|uniref:pirin family protein n=1 Tax=Alcaligenes sp. SDU_A2 TaxID=3136634 RepID=UPI00311EDBC3